MIKYFYLTHRWDLTDIATTGNSGPGSNVKEGLLHIP